MTQNNKTIRFEDFAAVTQDGDGVLGKLLYYSLSSVLVDRDELAGLCRSVGFPYKPGRRSAVADAFRSATGDICERLVLREPDGPQVIKVYCRDNRGQEGTIARELVKETVHESTNEYKKLANITLDRRAQTLSWDNLAYDDQVDPERYVGEIQRLFTLYQSCAGRRQIETLLENYVDAMEAVKVARGRIYFVPRDHMAQLQVFEDFISLLERHNLHQRPGRVPLDANSMYVVDDAKQRDKMAAAFYRTVQAELAEYEERAAHLIQSGSQSPAVMDRCVLRIQALEGKKAHYEEVLKRELSELDDQFASLRYLADELRLRAKGLRCQKRAA